MSVCAPWPCMGWRRTHECRRAYPAQQSGLAADGAGSRAVTAFAAPALVGRADVDRLCALAGANSTHALALSRDAGQKHGAGVDPIGGVLCTGDLDRAGCHGHVSAAAVYAQVTGNAQPTRRPGRGLSWLFYSGYGLSV